MKQLGDWQQVMQYYKKSPGVRQGPALFIDFLCQLFKKGERTPSNLSSSELLVAYSSWVTFQEVLPRLSTGVTRQLLVSWYRYL